MLGQFRRTIKKIIGGKRKQEITPDEIFLDASNLPDFDMDQFEGRLERPISKMAMQLILLSFLLLSIILFSRLWLLQVRDGQVYLKRSENNRLIRNYIFSNRGVIYDRNGKELVVNVSNSETDDFSKRQYPEIPGFSHVLGYVKYPKKDKAGFYWETSFIGKDGVENFYSDILLGENGVHLVEVDALNNVSSQGITRPPRDGENLKLSIDADLQAKFFEIISRVADDQGFHGGAGVMMDVQTGEILSLISYPEYDSNVLSEGEDSKKIREYIMDPRKPFLNRVVNGSFIPGSILKPLMILAVLKEDIIDPSKKILSTGSLSVPNPYFPGKFSVFGDWKAHGWVNMIDALAVSSDVYFYYIGGGFEDQEGLGISRIYKYMKLFGLEEETGIDLPGEIIGVIPTPEWKKENFDGDDWRLGDTYNTSIGQYGFQVTPIEALRAIASVANGGKLLQPTVLSLDNKDEKQKSKEVVFSEKSFDIVHEGMRQAVERGTAKGLNVSYVEVAAKTGTAEIGKRYLNSWVVGFLPYDNPKYAFTVLMERGPRSNSIGGVSVMRQLLDWMNVNTPQYLNQ